MMNPQVCSKPCPELQGTVSVIERPASAHGGNVYAPGPQGKKWLDFSANINPLGLSPSVKRALHSHIDDVVHYPDPDARELKAALSEHYGVPRENILPGNGAAEIFYLFFLALRPKTLILPVPSFSDYERAALAAGCGVKHFFLREEDGFRPKIGELFKEEGDALIIGNPNNPTGVILSREELMEILDFARINDLWLLVDESFLEFLPNYEELTMNPMIDAYEKLAVVSSLTKFYAMPGLRLGFAVMNEKLCKSLSAAKDVWNVNLLAQIAGVQALGDDSYRERTRELVAKERDFLSKELAKFSDFTIYPPSVNFILANARKPGENIDLASSLREMGILIRNCGNFLGLDPYFLRFAVRSRKENLRLLKALADVLRSKV